MKKFLCALIFSGLIVSSAFADIVAVKIDPTTNEGHLTYFTQDSSGKFTETSTSSSTVQNDAMVFSFMHKGKPRIIVGESQIKYSYGTNKATGATGYHTISIYDPSNLTTPLASRDIFSTNLFYLYSVVPHEDNVLLAGQINPAKNTGSIIELNPETCEIVGNPYVITNTNKFFAQLTTHNGKIYAVLAGHDEAGESSEILEMATFGTVSRTITTLPYTASQTLLSINGSLWIANALAFSNKDAGGLYKVTDDFKYEKIASEDVGNVCSDGSTGLYYGVYAQNSSNIGVLRYIYHWNGTSSSKVFDVETVSEDFKDNGVAPIFYDSKNNLLIAGFYYQGTRRGKILALTPDSSGNLTVSQQIDEVYTTFGVIDTSSQEKSDGTKTDSTLIEPLDSTKIDKKTVENIANDFGVTSNAILYVESENLSSPTAPTNEIKELISNDGYEITNTPQTVSVDKTGTYISLFDIPSSMIGTKTDEAKIYFVDQNNKKLDTAKIYDLNGVKAETLASKDYAVIELEKNTSYSTHIAKKVSSQNGTNGTNGTNGILSGSGGGCETGIGIFGLAFALGSLLIFKRS
ncbi:MAG: hypothetical protein IJP41_11005 [Synergistaceae bacterium]|nr:hypothetical protein [Synergistaceae bacterium]